MGRILDARGEEALDVLADLLDSISEIAGDAEISGMMKAGGKVTVAQLAAAILRRHKNAVVRIMAIDDGKAEDDERGLLSVITIPQRLIALLAIPEIKELFFGAAGGTGSASGSSSASESGRG